MSRDQYELMETNRLGSDDDDGQQVEPSQGDGPKRKSVYVIVQVYSLLSGKIGWEVFVDPWRLKDTVLKFKMHWEVVAREPN